MENRTYKVGDRVLYTQSTSIHCGALPHGGKSEATVVAAFGGGESLQSPTYRLLLDKKWDKRKNPQFAGEQIVVGSITENMLSPLSEKDESQSESVTEEVEKELV